MRDMFAGLRTREMHAEFWWADVKEDMGIRGRIL